MASVVSRAPSYCSYDQNVLFSQTKGDQELKTLLGSLDNVKSEFDGAADVITQMHKHFVTDDELK